MEIKISDDNYIILTNKKGDILKTPFQNIIPFSEHYFIGELKNYPINYKNCSKYFIVTENLEILNFPKVISVLPNNFIVTFEKLIKNEGWESRDGVSLEREYECYFIYNSKLEKLFSIDTFFLYGYKYLYWNESILIYYKDELLFGGIDFKSGKQYKSEYSFEEIQDKLNIMIDLNKEASNFYLPTQILWAINDNKSNFLSSEVILKDIKKFQKRTSK